MSDDNIRTHLVVRFKYAKCGRTLRLSYDGPKNMDRTDTGFYDEDKITGAAKVQSTACYIHPCANCYGAARRPVDMLKAALEAAEAVKGGEA